MFCRALSQTANGLVKNLQKSKLYVLLVKLISVFKIPYFLDHIFNQQEEVKKLVWITLGLYNSTRYVSVKSKSTLIFLEMFLA